MPKELLTWLETRESISQLITTPLKTYKITMLMFKIIYIRNSLIRMICTPTKTKSTLMMMLRLIYSTWVMTTEFNQREVSNTKEPN